MKKKIFSIILVLFLVFSNTLSYSHSGRTDSKGGHKDTKNKSGLGSYHYHCGGRPAHLHKDGKCPYAAKKSNSTINKELIMKVQERLNELGYDCGEIDGLLGPKTKAAVKAFQKDKNLTVDGNPGPETRKALGVD